MILADFAGSWRKEMSKVKQLRTLKSNLTYDLAFHKDRQLDQGLGSETPAFWKHAYFATRTGSVHVNVNLIVRIQPVELALILCITAHLNCWISSKVREQAIGCLRVFIRRRLRRQDTKCRSADTSHRQLALFHKHLLGYRSLRCRYCFGRYLWK